jgi:hypothetical protein
VQGKALVVRGVSRHDVLVGLAMFCSIYTGPSLATRLFSPCSLMPRCFLPRWARVIFAGLGWGWSAWPLANDRAYAVPMRRIACGRLADRRRGEDRGLLHGGGHGLSTLLRGLKNYTHTHRGRHGGGRWRLIRAFAREPGHLAAR